jgi:hypothetical protein
MGIDDFEHGPVTTDSEFVPGKLPDKCPDAVAASWVGKRASDPDVARLIHLLIEHHVAVTSTLPIFEFGIAGRKAQQRTLDAMATVTREHYISSEARLDPTDLTSEETLRAEMDFEHAFASAGGLLLAGSDPTAPGVLPGFGDQREIELLVEAGFTPVQAIAIGTRNGARFLGREQEIGTIAPGENADLILVHGDPAARISDIENVEIVFKDGVGYDPQVLLAAIRAQVGIR